MAVKHLWTTSVRSDAGGSVLASSLTYSASSEQNCSDVAAAGETLELDHVIVVADLKSFYIVSSQDVTLQTNSTSSPTQEKTLKAGIPLAWNTDYDGANPLTTNITKLFFVNDGTTDANVKGSFLLDLNPS